MSLVIGRRTIQWPKMLLKTTQLHRIRDLTFRKYFNTNACKHASFKTSKDIEIESVRNIGILAHIDAGKTTTTERILYYTGFTRYLGNVDQGTTVTDYMEQERNRGITITSAAVTCYWKKHKLNLIDTPGHVDFTVEVERALRVLDGAVTILDASAGVEAQTLTVWRQASRYSVPQIIFLNKMDKPKANVRHCLQSVQHKLQIEPLLLCFPLGSGKDFTGFVDLVTLEMWTWSKESRDGSQFSVEKIDESNEDLFEEVMAHRTHLIGQLSDLSETIAEYVLQDYDLNDIPAEAIHSAIRQVTLKQKAVPVLCGSSLKNKGVQHLLSCINHYLPSPLDIEHDFLKYYGKSLVCLAFKIIHDKQRGPLTFLRIYNGELVSGASIYNVNQKQSEKVMRLLQVNANEFEDISRATSGSIVCAAGFKQTITGDSLVTNHATADAAMKLYKKDRLSQQDEEESNHIDSPVLAGLDIPDPVFFCSVEADSISDQKHLDYALECLQKEDPTLSVRINPDTGETVLCGMGELHLDIIRNRIKEEYNLEVHLGSLQVAYKETIKETAYVSEILDKTLGEQRHQMFIALSVEPSETRNFQHVNLVHTKENNLTQIHRNHLNAIENGVKSALTAGLILNFPVIHVSVSLHEVSIGSRTSLPMISACVMSAVQKALRKANTFLMEPLMNVQISCEETYLNGVLGDLAKRRSQIASIQQQQDLQFISALTPVSEMVGYTTTLRTLTSGMASFSMELSHYESLSPEKQAEVIEQISGFSQNN
ncbi:ribosome-releasing factor 2, mitochondrial isoform X1 [Octopus sinensis]|uniref:Ribosome-releasing factor 2, mitochondrial isoform X1 n=1 Tax=Octopus sinensis TaxID=2607531 RepID=A0A6P7SAI1_9MOLL|nr:ribosome-releasing factor 2, mitochondrial isoform X1 [Octopus sinensis]